MEKPIKNSASQYPRRYFGLHFAPGVAQYHEPGTDPYKIFLNQDTINKSDPTFEGKLIFVQHRDVVKPEMTIESDGVVVKSFFNQNDGKQWCEFLITSDAGHNAIASGYSLSNSYIVKNVAPGGTWHAVPYEKEVTEFEYEHLALVPNPRYKESVVMTPQEFKKYNEDKSLELKRLTNSEGKKPMFNFFKKTKVDNNVDLDTMSVILPKSGKEVELSKLINDADESEDPKHMADHKHMVAVHDEVMSVGDLVSAHEKLKQDHAKLKVKHDELKQSVKPVDKEQPGADAEKEAAAAGEQGDQPSPEAKKADAGTEPDKAIPPKDKQPESPQADEKGKDQQPESKGSLIEEDKKNLEQDPGAKEGEKPIKAEEKKEKAEEAAELKEKGPDKKSNSSHFNVLKAAEAAAITTSKPEIVDSIELGRQLYGSK